MEEIYHVQPWSPEIVTVTEEIINNIHKATPELEVLFMGAAALGLPGKNDIDLDILCSVETISDNIQKLVPILGEPREVTSELAAWTFFEKGFEVDAILSDPKTSHVPVQKKVFETLKSNPILLEEYRRLKIDCDGMPYAEYKLKKEAFFEKCV